MHCPLCGRPVFQPGHAAPPKRWCSDACRVSGNARLRTLRRQRERAESDGLTRRIEYLNEWIDRLEGGDAGHTKAR